MHPFFSSYQRKGRHREKIVVVAVVVAVAADVVSIIIADVVAVVY